MESVLEVYQSPYDPDFPVLCLDEKLKTLVKETIVSIKAKSGQRERYDYHYNRNGTANLFMVCNPLEGWRMVKVTEQRRAVDFAHLIKELVDSYFIDAYRITLVLDQLNTHAPASLRRSLSSE